MDSELALYIAAAVALVSVVALIVVLVRTSRERQRLMKEYEDAEDELQERLLKMSSEKAAVESKLAASEEYEARMREVQDNALKMQKEQHEKDLENMRDAFNALSAENSAVFKKQSAESIGELLKPIREKFTEFGDAVRESRKEALQQNAELKEHIRGVMDRSNAVGEEARNLANALTGYSKVQGDFGEMLLTDVLKNSGLQEGVHFFTQGVMTDSSGHEIKSESGRTMIPDVMVFYPDDTTVIIDSKVASTNGQGHGALAWLLQGVGADTLICGGIGGGAQSALSQAGITLYGGVTGSADEAVNRLIAGTLEYDPNVVCNHHHDHGDGDCGHHHHEDGEGCCGHHHDHDEGGCCHD